MLNSRLEKLAMDQMEKMSPEQLALLERQVGSLGPGAMERVHEKLAAMTDSEVENIEKKMQETDPSTFPATSSTLRARHTHFYQVSLRLKNEGNGLFHEGKFDSACAKYDQAKGNLSMLLDQESHDLSIICSLNLANCYLKLNQHEKCIQQCSEVLKNQPENKKALFRRGQALIGQDQLQEGLEDLKKALKFSEGDPKEEDHITKKILEVENQLKINKVPIEEIPRPEPQPQPQESSKVLGKLSEEELKKMSEMTGFEVSPEMVRSGIEAMSKLDSETLAKMPALAQKLSLNQNSRNLNLRNPNSDQKTDFSMTPENLSSMSEVFKNNPQLIQEQARKLSQMPQEELDKIAKLSGAPSGLKITPEMAQKASEMFQKMDPEELHRLPKLASQASAPVQDPAQAMEVLDSLDEASMAEMLVATGVCKDQGLAERVSKQVKQLSPQQLQRLMKLQQVTSKGVGIVKKMARSVLTREALTIAILILIFAVVIRNINN